MNGAALQASADAGPSIAQRYRATRARRGILLAALGCAVLCSLMVDLSIGPAALGVPDIFQGMIDPASLSPRDRVVLWDIRLPDALIALVVGAALALAGVEAQTALNNPLASPFTLGVSAAATLGAALAIVYGGVITTMLGLPSMPETVSLPLLAMIFALFSGSIVLLFARSFGAGRETIVLFGVAVFFVCEALVALLQMLADAEAVQRIVLWSVGSLTRVGWTELAVVTAGLALAAPLAWRRAASLTLMRGGEAQAQALGVAVERLRIESVLRLSALTAVAVCFVGTISFVGLVAPHIARLVLGEDHRLLIPGAMLVGALLLSVASALSRELLPGAVIPVGIITAIIGAPALVALLVSRGGRA